MKKILLIALAIAMICLAMVGCTPKEDEGGTTSAPVASLIEPTGQMESDAADSETAVPDGMEITETAAPMPNSDASDDPWISNEPSEPVATEEPEEEIPDSYVIDIGEDVGVGGN